MARTPPAQGPHNLDHGYGRLCLMAPGDTASARITRGLREIWPSRLPSRWRRSRISTLSASARPRVRTVRWMHRTARRDWLNPSVRRGGRRGGPANSAHRSCGCWICWRGRRFGPRRPTTRWLVSSVRVDSRGAHSTHSPVCAPQRSESRSAVSAVSECTLTACREFVSRFCYRIT